MTSTVVAEGASPLARAAKQCEHCRGKILGVGLTPVDAALLRNGAEKLREVESIGEVDRDAWLAWANESNHALGRYDAIVLDRRISIPVAWLVAILKKNGQLFASFPVETPPGFRRSSINVDRNVTLYRLGRIHG